MKLLLFLLTALGLLLICKEAIGFAPNVRNKNVKSLRETRGMDRLVYALANPIAKRLKLSQDTERYLKEMLAECELAVTPQQYYARAIVMGVLVLPLTPLIVLAGVPYLWPVTLLLAVLIYMKYVNQIKDKREEKRKAQQRAMPHFVRSVLAQVNTVRADLVQIDLLKVMEDYLKVADAAFYQPVAKLVSDMKITGDLEYSLETFEKRIMLPEITALTNALIGIHRGEDHLTALQFIARDADQRASELIKNELTKRPGKVNRLSLPLVGLGVFALFYCLILYMFNTFTTI